MKGCSLWQPLMQKGKMAMEGGLSQNRLNTDLG